MARDPDHWSQVGGTSLAVGRFDSKHLNKNMRLSTAGRGYRWTRAVSCIRSATTGEPRRDQAGWAKAARAATTELSVQSENYSFNLQLPAGIPSAG